MKQQNGRNLATSTATWSRVTLENGIIYLGTVMSHMKEINGYFNKKKENIVNVLNATESYS